MPRPIRIEYDGAFHHVMNRGRNHASLFHDERYYEAFLKCLQESSEQFDAVIHAYCLVTNHYHLLIETPYANLARIMRHINGVYTQRHNGLKKTDGPLFKGRYKAVLVDQDEYLLQLTRYIHLNPIETKKPMVSKLGDYRWSSFPAYINQSKAPSWLQRDKTYQMLGHRKKYSGYLKYVEQGVDEDIKRYYGRYNLLSVLGDAEFKAQAQQMAEDDKLEPKTVWNNQPSCDEIIQLVAEYSHKKPQSLCAKVPNKHVSNAERAFAMYACRHYGRASQKELMETFQLKHLGSSAYAINKIRQQIEQGQWRKLIKWLEKALNIVKSA
ncbi:MAG: transposase [Enterobacterales bacterium]|nr:transposase [Enterobacterales bacterium]